jgi:hypothetical protein
MMVFWRGMVQMGAIPISGAIREAIALMARRSTGTCVPLSWGAGPYCTLRR